MAAFSQGLSWANFDLGVNLLGNNGDSNTTEPTGNVTVAGTNGTEDTDAADRRRWSLDRRSTKSNAKDSNTKDKSGKKHTKEEKTSSDGCGVQNLLAPVQVLVICSFLLLLVFCARSLTVFVITRYIHKEQPATLLFPAWSLPLPLFSLFSLSSLSSSLSLSLSLSLSRHTHAHARAHACAHARTRTHTRTHAHARTCAHTRTHVHAHAHTYIHTCTHAQTNKDTYAHTCTHTQGRPGISRTIPRALRFRDGSNGVAMCSWSGHWYTNYLFWSYAVFGLSDFLHHETRGGGKIELRRESKAKFC